MTVGDGFETRVGDILREAVAQVPPHPSRWAALTTARRRRTAVRVTVGAAAVVTVGAAAVAVGAAGSGPAGLTAEPSGGPTPTAAAPVATPKGVPFDLYTHCGIRYLEFQGRTFKAEHALVGEGDNPPPGWGNPYQPGRLTVVGPDRVRFTATGLPDVDFVVTDDVPPLCM